MKRFISLCLALLMVIGSVNAFAEESRYPECVEKIWYEDFEAWSASSMYKTSGASWSIPGSSQISVYLEEDPKNKDNHVLAFDRTVNKSDTGYVTLYASSAKNGIACIGMKLYIPENSDGIVIEGHTGKYAQVPLQIWSGGAKAKGRPLTTAQIKTNDWNDIYIEAYPETKRYHVWINGECCTENGKVLTAEGAAYDSTGGIEYAYYDRTDITEYNIKGFRLFNQKNWCHYMDDVYMNVDYSSVLSKVADFLDFDVIGEGQSVESVTGNLNLISAYEHDGSTYAVEWESADTKLLSHDGTVTRKSFAKDVALTAKIYKDKEKDIYIKKVFNLTISPLDGASDAVILQEYANLYINESEFTAESKDALTKNLSKLPTEGPSGITISWKTDTPESITAEGAVTRPEFGEGDSEVQLTATIRLNSEELIKVLNYTVLEKPDPDLMLEQAAKDITYSALTAEDRDAITNNLSLPKTGSNNTTITWESDSAAITPEGIVTRGDGEEVVTLTATIDFDGFTATKEFRFTVLPTERKMIEADLSYIDMTGWDALEKSFDLPTIGTRYKTAFSWESDNEAIVINASRAVVCRPSFEEGDKSFSLKLTAVYGETKTIEYYPVTVLSMVPDTQLVAEAMSTLTDEVICPDGTDSVTGNLPLVTTAGEDVTVKWKSSNESVITPDGEVFRPAPGEEAATVTLTATFTRNYATDEKTYTVTVLPFETEQEMFECVYNSLLFANLSSEAIDEVTVDLTLPSAWKYDSTVSWSSNSKNITISGETGLVTRPEWGSTNASVKLTANITMGDISREKVFNIKILEKDYMEYVDKIWYEDFEEWTEDSMYTTDSATWKVGAADEIDVYLSQDPLNAENQVLTLDKTVNKQNTGYVTALAKSAKGGIVQLGMKVYMSEDSKGMSIEITTGDYAQCPMSIFPGGARITSKRTLSTAQIKENDWNEIYIEAYTGERKYHVWINGECCTENGKVINEDGTVYDTSGGVKYNYYDSASIKEYDLKGFRIYSNKDCVNYIDDIYMDNKLVYSDTQLSLAEAWEQEFLAQNNINAICSDLILPQIWEEGIVISYASSNSSAIDLGGRFNLTEGEKDVTWTVTFSDGYTVYKREYTLHAVKSATAALTDAEAAAADAEEMIRYLSENYLLSNLKGSLTFKTTGTNGSAITVSSSDTSVISNSGVVTLGNSKKTVTLTITALKNGQSAQKAVTVTVGIKESGESSTSSSSAAGSSGIKVVSGVGTVKQSGIEVTQPEENSQDEVAFGDLSAEHWAYTELMYMVKNGIMNGTGGENIEPERTILREEFIKMLVIAMGLDLTHEVAGFSDISENAWYAPYIAAAKRSGLVNGYEDGRAGIGENITREDMAVMIYRAANLAESGRNKLFGDDAVISPYAQAAVYTLRDIGVINGKDNGNFAPKATATRAETACMLYRAIKKELFN